MCICHKIVNFSFLFGIGTFFQGRKPVILNRSVTFVAGKKEKQKAMQQTEVDNQKWYVLYTAPRAEKQVESRIQGMGVICWLPLHKSPRAWSDRVKIVDIPLFPSYIFVKCAETDLYKLLRIPGVSRIVYYNGKPAVVREKELDSIRTFLEEAANHPLMEGEEAEIVCGVMKHVSGKIRRIRKKYLLLYLAQLGAHVCVSLEKVYPVNRIR